MYGPADAAGRELWVNVDEAGEEWKVRGFLSSPHRQAEVQIWFNQEPVFIFSLPPSGLEERNSIEAVSLERHCRSSLHSCFFYFSFSNFYKKVSSRLFLFFPSVGSV